MVNDIFCCLGDDGIWNCVLRVGGVDGGIGPNGVTR